MMMGEKLKGFVEYLNHHEDILQLKSEAQQASDFDSLDVLEECLKTRAVSIIMNTAQEFVGDSEDELTKWNEKYQTQLV